MTLPLLSGYFIICTYIYIYIGNYFFFFSSSKNNTVGLMTKINFIFYKIILFHILSFINFTSVFHSTVNTGTRYRNAE